MTAEEFAAKAINERGYLVVTSSIPYAPGDHILGCNYRDDPALMQPMSIVEETTAADFQAQLALDEVPHVTSASVGPYFYRVTTD